MFWDWRVTLRMRVLLRRWPLLLFFVISSILSSHRVDGTAGKSDPPAERFVRSAAVLFCIRVCCVVIVVSRVLR